MKKVRLIRICLVALLILSIFAGCGGKEGNPVNTGGSPEATETQPGNQLEESKPTLKILSFYANFDPNENPIKGEIEELTGYNLEYFMLPQETDKADEKLNITISSGSDYDILKLRPYQYYRLVKQGALQELDAFIEEYGSTMSEVIKPLSWEVAKSNGKTYAVPLSNERPNIANSIAMRKDLLDAAGIKVPTTLDEFTDALRKLKEKYPDMIPMTGPGRIDQQMYLNTFVPVIGGAFGIYNEWTDVDGKLVHYVNMPGFKEYLAYLTELYEESLIDVDWPINTLASCNEKFTSGKAVMDPYHYNDASANYTALTGNFPEAEIVYVNALEGPYGSGVRIERKINYFNCVPKSSPNAEHAIKFIDSFLKYENFEYLTLGAEGTHFKKNGSSFDPIMPIFNDERFWSYWYLMGIDEYKYPDMWLARIKKDPYQYANFEAINKNIDEVGHLDVVGFAPTIEAVANNQQTLRQMINDYSIRVLAGADSIDNYNTILEKWKQEGGDAMTNEMNAWYKDFVLANPEKP